jgi:hypothetical protein
VTTIGYCFCCSSITFSKQLPSLEYKCIIRDLKIGIFYHTTSNHIPQKVYDLVIFTRYTKSVTISMASTALHPSPRAPGSALPPFPEDVPIAPLVTISLCKIAESTFSIEHERLFSAAKSLGFFYLDVRGTPEGEHLLQQVDDMFNIMDEFFSLPIDEKAKYDFAAKKSYFGYKGIGKEVVDGKGTRDKNEIYNVSQPL